MNKTILILLFIVFSLFSFSQTTKTIVDLEKLSEQELGNISQSVSQKGWVLLKDKNHNYILNCSNKDYHLFFSITCEKVTDRPGFHIEFSNNYRDGSYGGIDFLSSNDDREVQILLDGKSFQNPFKNYEETLFKKFTEALRNAKILTIEVYDHYDFTQELKLNRSINFKLENGDLLDYPVQCNE